MQIKNVIIDNIQYINFITFNITTLLFPWFAPLKLGYVLYTRASFKPSNTVILFLSELELICLQTVKYFWILLFNTNNSILY